MAEWNEGGFHRNGYSLLHGEITTDEIALLFEAIASDTSMTSQFQMPQTKHKTGLSRLTGSFQPSPSIADAYLDLMERILTGVIIEDPPIVTKEHEGLVRSVGKSLKSTYNSDANYDPDEKEIGRYRYAWREAGWDTPSQAFTMVGLKRLRNFRLLVQKAIAEDVSGDILEAGVWRGGSSIMARAVLRAAGDNTRRVFVADSFEGLPSPQSCFSARRE